MAAKRDLKLVFLDDFKNFKDLRCWGFWSAVVKRQGARQACGVSAMQRAQGGRWVAASASAQVLRSDRCSLKGM